jgi:hypothetical protein
VRNKLRIGFQKAPPDAPDFYVTDKMIENAEYYPVLNGTDKYKNAFITINNENGAISASFGAFVENGYDPAQSNDKDNKNYWRFSVWLADGLDAGSIKIDKISIGMDNPDSSAPWHNWDPGVKIQPLSEMSAPPPLPSGNTGIAANYSFDEGIERHQSVIKSDNFRDCPTGRITDKSEVSKWTGLRLQNTAYMYIVEQGQTELDGSNKSDPGAGHKRPVHGAGKLKDTVVGKEVDFDNAIPGGKDAKAAVYWTNRGAEGSVNQNFAIELQNYFDYDSELEEAFVRSYHYWAPNSGIVGSSHNGMTFSGLDKRLTNGSVGAPDWLMINGFETFNSMVEHVHPAKSPIQMGGRISTYIYYPEMHNVPYGDHFFADGRWTPAHSGYRPGDPERNPYFKARPDFHSEANRWYCYEFMLKLNSVKNGIAQRDGRVACWVDGEIVYDFPNLVLRYTDELKINTSRLLLINSGNRADFGFETYKMVTNYVVAREYIGPTVF